MNHQDLYLVSTSQSLTPVPSGHPGRNGHAATAIDTYCLPAALTDGYAHRNDHQRRQPDLDLELDLMTSFPDSGGYHHDITGAAGFMADEHLTMHLYMFESAADDPASRTPMTGPGESWATQPSPDPLPTERVPGKVRIRTYP